MTNAKKPYRVLFMQSQTYFGADSRIHAILMRHFDREQVDVHAALNYGQGAQKSASARAIEATPGVNIRPTNFGVTVNERSRFQILSDAFRSGVPAALSLGGLARYIRKHDINLIHCTEKPRDAFYGYHLSRLTGAKCVVHLHVKAEDWINRKVQWAMHRAPGLIGVSEFVAGSMREMGFPEANIYFAHNSLELDGWQPGLGGESIRQEFNIPAGMPLLLIVSRLFYWKGHSQLIEALAQVKQKMPDFRLLVVGEDDPRAHPGGGSYLVDLKERVRKYELSEQVIFTGFRSDTARLYDACDIYTMPSFEEPFGVVYLEAMAMQKPVIALDNGGSREIVEHGVSGLLSPVDDTAKLAENILALLLDPKLRVQMGECGRRKVEEYFTPARMCSDVLKIYQKIIEK
jgi:glycosyltransferase involved in cell wall biosynthesis